jgi:hypothetical protein
MLAFQKMSIFVRFESPRANGNRDIKKMKKRATRWQGCQIFIRQNGKKYKIRQTAKNIPN